MDNRLRIALISEHASPLAGPRAADGADLGIEFAHLAHSLARSGHQVDVLTRCDSPQLPAALDVRPGLRVLHLRAGPAMSLPNGQLLEHTHEFGWAALQLFLHSVPYDVVHACHPMSALVGLRLKAMLGMPLVVDSQAFGPLSRDRAGCSDALGHGALEQRVLRAADRIVATSAQHLADLARVHGADPTRLALLPGGVDAHEFAPGSKAQARRTLGWSDDTFVILQRGRLGPQEGVDDAVQALAYMDLGRPVRLMVTGTHDDHARENARLRRLARHCGVAASVVFAGALPHSTLRDHCVAADVCLSTPWHEPDVGALLQAMACATPVVASRVGAMRHTVVDGVTGCLVPPREPQLLAQRLGGLRANPAWAAALGRAGACRVRARHTWDRVALDLLDIYQGARLHARAARHAVAMPTPDLPPHNSGRGRIGLRVPLTLLRPAPEARR